MAEKVSNKTQRHIDALSGTTVSGELVDETDEAITIKTGNSLFEIPREFVKRVSPVESTGGQKLVDALISRDAKIMQKTLVTGELVSGVTAGVSGAIADWPWHCHCRCICQCRPCYCYYCRPCVQTMQGQMQDVPQSVIDDAITQFRKKMNTQG